MTKTGNTRTERLNVVKDENTNASTKNNDKTMYLEIHPYWYDNMLAHNEMFDENRRPQKDYYKPANPRLIRLDIIQEIEDRVCDEQGNVVFKQLVISDDYINNIIVTKEEADRIQKMLLKINENPLITHIDRLATAVEKLCEIVSKSIKQ